MKCFVFLFIPFAAFVCAIDIMYPVSIDEAGGTTQTVAVVDTGRGEARKKRQEDRAKRERVRKLSRKAK